MGARIVGTPQPDGNGRVVITLQYTENGQDVGNVSTGDLTNISFLELEVDTPEKSQLILNNFSTARQAVRANTAIIDLSHLNNLSIG